MLQANIDYLVLGCTHYPYLIPLLEDLLPKHVKIIDSGLAVAKQTKAVLNSNQLLNTSSNKSSIKFFSNGELSVLNSILSNAFDTNYLDF